MAPLRIGILGAARIAREGIVDPARTLGHRLVAVAASDPTRAEAFAAEHGVERALPDYQSVVDDPEVDVIYNPLINSLHAEWNIKALQAGKQVLSEKPWVLNAGEAHAVREVERTSAGTLVEGFHYFLHPSVQRIGELIRSGALGQLTGVTISLDMEPPPAGDPRWSYELGGGALMDIGCYVLHAHRQLAKWINADEPRVTTATAATAAGAPWVDQAVDVDLDYLGVPAVARWNMNSQRRMVWTVSGTQGSVSHQAFAVPHMDNRLLVTLDAHTTTELLGEETSYTYQLRRYADFLAGGPAMPSTIDDAVANAELIDAVYRAAGLPPRGSGRPNLT